MEIIDKKQSNILNNLEGNPLFQLSLGAKELFHSNFMGWVLSLDEQFTEAFLKQTGLLHEEANVKKCQVEREYLNFDIFIHLVLQDGKKMAFIIENKVKSIPDEDQLKRYFLKYHERSRTKAFKEKFGIQPNESVEAHFLVLWFNHQNSQFPNPWKPLRYTQVVEALVSSHYNHPLPSAGISFENLLQSYQQFIIELNALFEYLNDHRLYDYYTSKFFKELNNIRLQDLAIKYTHSLMVASIKKQVKPATWKKENELNNIGDCSMHQDYNRKQGCIDFKCVVALSPSDRSPLIIGVQLQGTQLRYVIKNMSQQQASQHYDLAIELLEKGLWLCHQEEVLSGMIEIPEANRTKGSGTKHSPARVRGKFNTYYKGKFLYKFDKIPATASRKEVEAAFTALANHVISNQNTFTDKAERYGFFNKVNREVA